MGRTEELSDFQRGTVIGCHLAKKSIREISAMLELPRSTVGAVIVKWKRLGITTPLPRSGRPHKISDRDLQVLERVASENRLSSVATLTSEFQNASGSTVSPRTVRRELHGMGFRGQAATRKSKIIRRNAKQDLAEPSKKKSAIKSATSTGEEAQESTDTWTAPEPAVTLPNLEDSSPSQSITTQS